MMSKRKKQSKDTPDVVPFDPSAHEEMMKDLRRLLSQQNFGSPEEMQAFIEREVIGKPLPKVKPVNDVERAQDLLDEARRMDHPDDVRSKIAEALLLDPNSVAAHTLLSEVEDVPLEALEHARRAIAAGEKLLKEELAAGDEHLWYHPVGREYLLARMQCAELLWASGERRLALAEGQDILRAHHNDNAGFRYTLLQWLMMAGSVAEIDGLFNKYRDEHSTQFLYTAALHHVRLYGLDDAADLKLKRALEVNPHVVAILTGDEPPAYDDGMGYRLGSPEEATIYLRLATSVWLATEFAIDWASDTAFELGFRKRAKRRR